jgi:Mn2+/Fe2+ NRAMP family transporter
MCKVMPRGLVGTLVALLFLANTINIGADLAAMGEAAELMLGSTSPWVGHGFTIFFALLTLTLQLFVPYKRYARFLTLLTLSLLTYVAVLFLLKLDWDDILAGMAGINAALTPAAATVIVAVFGTTISPYLFFWQSAQEVEEVAHDGNQHPLTNAPREAPQALRDNRIDTIVGMFPTNPIALAIMIATAATLHRAGITEIETAAQAAGALRPIAGDFAFLLFSLGIIGTGLLAVPVLAGSVAYAVGETEGWRTGLDNMPWQAKGFYGVIGAAVLLGIGIDFSPIDPFKALYWSAVINGLIAVPMMAAMMFVARDRCMGQFCPGPWLTALGWLSTAVMAAAAAAMVYFTVF